MKKLFALLFVLLICVCFAFFVQAEEIEIVVSETELSYSDLSGTDLVAIEPIYIDDAAGVLTDREEEKLMETILATKEEFSCDIGVYVVSVGDIYLSDYDARLLCENRYLENGLGNNGIMLMIFLSDVKGYSGTHMATRGECIDIFSEDIFISIEDNFYNYLVDGRYSRAVASFVEDSADYIHSFYTFNFIWVLIGIVIGVVVGFISVGVMKNQLKSVALKPNASEYAKAGSLKLINSSDVFLYKSVTRTAKPKDTGRSGSGGGSSFGGHSGGRF